MQDAITRRDSWDGPQPTRPALIVLIERMSVTVLSHDPGWQLPRQSMLARTFNASLADVEVAVRDLEARHLIRRLADGRLCRASPAEYLISLDGLPGIGSRIDPMGATIACHQRHVSWRRVPEEIALSLGLAPGAPASTIRCQWTANGQRAALSTTYLSAPLDTAGPAPGSLEAVLNTPPPEAVPPGPEIRAVPAALHIEVQPPGKAEARSLQLDAGTPAITVTVSFRDLSLGHPLALTTAVLRSDLFRIVVDTPGCTPPLTPDPAAPPADPRLSQYPQIPVARSAQ